MKHLTILLVVTLLLSGFAGAGGSSIFRNAESHVNTPGGLFSDNTARRVGDVLTIKVEEEMKIDTKSSDTGERKGKVSGKGSGTLTLNDFLPGVARSGTTWTLPEFELSAENTTKNDGTADRSRSESYEDQITVVVEDVMPNGSLVVLGKRTREVGGNVKVAQLSGIVRRSDIESDNTVPSSRLANFHIVYTEDGRDQTYLRPGWLTRIWNLLSPF